MAPAAWRRHQRALAFTTQELAAVATFTHDHIPAAAKILAIDGCPQECARKTLEQAGFTGFQHLTLASLGLRKGSSPATDEMIRLVANKGAELLALTRTCPP
jgi:uncharacterized metal-binding protein